jgi:hypothetical protein
VDEAALRMSEGAAVARPLPVLVGLVGLAALLLAPRAAAQEALAVGVAPTARLLVDSVRLVDCAGTTDASGFINCQIPNYQPQFNVAGVDPVLIGPVGGQRNLPSATIYRVSIDQTNDVVRLRIIGTEVVPWVDGHVGPIPYRSGPVQLQLQLFLDAT